MLAAAIWKMLTMLHGKWANQSGGRAKCPEVLSWDNGWMSGKSSLNSLSVYKNVFFNNLFKMCAPFFFLQHSGRSKLCQFKEVLNNAYREFHSVFNQSWKLGFKKTGKPLKGDYYTRKARLSDCYKFTLVDRSHKHRHHHGYSPVSTEEVAKWYKRQQLRGLFQKDSRW